MLPLNFIKYKLLGLNYSIFTNRTGRNKQVLANLEIGKITDFHQNYAYFRAPKPALLVISIKTQLFYSVFQCTKMLKSMKIIFFQCLLIDTCRYKQSKKYAHLGPNMLIQGHLLPTIPPFFAIFDFRIGFNGSKTLTYTFWYPL